MRIARSLLITSASFAFCASAFAETESLTVTLDGIANGAPLPQKFAYCLPDEKGQSSMTGKNISPAISWSKGPEGTKSYAVIMVDPDVPAVFDDAGKEGKTLPADMPRQNFYHWTVVGIPADVNSIAEGKGKDASVGTLGVSDYPKFMGKEDTQPYMGYDGACPPWNDERVHHYHFQVFALDTEKPEGLKETFTGAQAEAAIVPHVLAKGEVVATYTLNAKLLGK